MVRPALPPVKLLCVLTGLNLLNYIDRYVLPSVLPLIQKSAADGGLGLNDAQAGTLNTAFMIGYFLTSPLFGFLGDRMSRKWLIAAGILVWSVGTVLTGFATGFGMMIAFRVLVGVGEASYATISPSLISDSYGPARRNNALTIFYVAIPVGSALGFALGSWLGSTLGWHHAFIWTGLPGLALALVLLPFKDPPRGQAEGRAEEASHAPAPLDVLKLFQRTDYMLVAWGYVAYTAALGGFAFWAPSYLHRLYGVSVEAAGLYFGQVLVVAGLLGTFAGGFAATAWQRRNPSAYALTLGLSVLVATPIAAWAFLTDTKGECMTLLAIAMFLLFLPTGPINTLILETVPINLRASAMALSIFLIHAFGDMWSPQIVGWVSDRLGETPAALQRAVLILPGALLGAAVLWLWLAWRQRGGRTTPAAAS